jgi:hypothetical protein
MVSERLKEVILEFRAAASELYGKGVHPFRFGKSIRIIGGAGGITDEILDAIRKFRAARTRLTRAILEEPI